MVLRILAVEDLIQHRQIIARALENPLSSDDQKRYGIEALTVVYAESKEDAITRINEAERKGEPFHIVLLDVMIPERKPLPGEDPLPPEKDNGLAVLTVLRDATEPQEVLVYSVLKEYKVAVQVFMGGAVDYIPKSVVGPELLFRVLAAGARLLARQNKNLLDQRLKHLVPYAETGLAHRLGVCFSRFVQAVVNETEGLQEGLKERWGLDIERDANDPQVRHLIEMESAVQQAKKDWTEIVAKLNESNEEIADCMVQDALREVKAELGPSLSLNRVILNFDETAKTYVRTFRNGADDVKAVLQEILLGGLSEPLGIGSQITQDHPSEAAEPRPVNVKIDTNNGQVEVRFEDSLTPIDGQSADLINQGLIVPPGKSFGRAWGLSVAQQLAQRGGGKLKIQATGDDNVITYSIPLADPDHAKSASGR